MYHRLLFFISFTSLIICQEQQPKLDQKTQALIDFCTANENMFTEIKTHLGLQPNHIDYKQWPLLNELLSCILKNPTLGEGSCRSASAKQLVIPRYNACIYPDKDAHNCALHFKFKGSTVTIPQAHNRPITTLLKISPGLCATGAYDGTINIWHVPTQQIISQLHHPNTQPKDDASVKDLRITHLAHMQPNILFSVACNRIIGWNMCSGTQIFSVIPQCRNKTTPVMHFNVNSMRTLGSTLQCSDADNRMLTFDFSNVVACKEKIEESLELQDFIVLNYLQRCHEEKKKQDEKAKPHITWMYGIAKKNNAEKLTVWLKMVGDAILKSSK